MRPFPSTHTGLQKRDVPRRVGRTGPKTGYAWMGPGPHCRAVVKVVFGDGKDAEVFRVM